MPLTASMGNTTRLLTADMQHTDVAVADIIIGPRYHRRPTESRPDDGEHPLPRCLMLSATRSRWGQRLGQKKAVN